MESFVQDSCVSVEYALVELRASGRGCTAATPAVWHVIVGMAPSQVCSVLFSFYLAPCRLPQLTAWLLKVVLG